ncbi:MAG: hypothetical protein RLZZ519_2901 [Bacteroidota bacterium]|jgi:hypothetical protein
MENGESKIGAANCEAYHVSKPAGFSEANGETKFSEANGEQETAKLIQNRRIQFLR